MIETNVIPIEYDENTLEETLRLKEILEKNEILFKIFLAQYKKISFLETKDKDILEISSIEEFKEITSYVIPTYLKMFKDKIYEESKHSETSFLKIMLIDKVTTETSNVDKELLTELKLNINTIYAVAAINFYEKEEDLIEFIFNPTDKEKEKIFNWLNSKERYNLINLLLEEEYQILLELESMEKDNYIRTHLQELLELTEIDIEDRLKTQNKKDKNLPKITQDELDKLCIEFLIKIDPSLKWLKLYNELKAKENILYGEKFPDSSSEWGCIQTTDEIYIYMHH